MEIRFNFALIWAWRGSVARLHIRLCSQDLIETLPDGAVVDMIAAIAAASVAKDSIRAAIAPVHR
jgi:hypothetical protein